MKFQLAAIALLSSSASAFVPNNPHGNYKTNLKALAEETTDVSRPVNDPLSLYPESSEERQGGRINPLESQLEVVKPVTDPMGLYPKDSPEFLESLQQEIESSSVASQDRSIVDPLNLYPASSSERQEGKVQLMEPTVEITKGTIDPMGLYPQDSLEFREQLELEERESADLRKQLYDPLGLYPHSAHKEGTIRAMEPRVNVIKPVLDPLGLYDNKVEEDQVEQDVVLSQALPFMAKPAHLDGALAGDAGFDPLGFAAKSPEYLLSMRVAELKHSRIAMLAVVGWPLSELWDQKLAALWHLKPLLVEGDRVPSLLNGGLLQVNVFYWMGVLAIAGFVEGLDLMKSSTTSAIFDPFKLYPTDKDDQKRMQLAEIKHGRVAMSAITIFAMVEAFTQQGIVHTTPFFFQPPF